VATFADQIRSDLQGRVLLGIADEKRILRMGVESWGLNYGVARNELLTVAAASRVALRSDVDAAVAGFLETVATRNGLVRQADFEQAAALYRTRTGNRIGLPQARSLVKAVMISRNLQPRAAGWFWRTRSWFTSIPDAPPEPVAPVPPGQQFATQPGIAGGVPVARILGAWAAAVNARRPRWSTSMRRAPCCWPPAPPIRCAARPPSPAISSACSPIRGSPSRSTGRSTSAASTRWW
jgi:hypothetical protein